MQSDISWKQTVNYISSIVVCLKLQLWAVFNDFFASQDDGWRLNVEVEVLVVSFFVFRQIQVTLVVKTRNNVHDVLHSRVPKQAHKLACLLWMWTGNPFSDLLTKSVTSSTAHVIAVTKEDPAKKKAQPYSYSKGGILESSAFFRCAISSLTAEMKKITPSPRTRAETKHLFPVRLTR